VKTGTAGPQGAGVKRALERIYRRHRQGLFTLALTVTRSPAAAEDAVQEAFARLWRLKKRPAGDPVAYVFAAVRNAATDQLRRRREPPADAAASIFNGSVTSPEAAALEAERQRLLAEAVEALPEAQREAIVLRVYADLSFAQMAEALGEPLPTVAGRYRRGLERLRETMARTL
jgi:RNA polymerase sigma-70 factor (ECF subfamily)